MLFGYSAEEAVGQNITPIYRLIIVTKKERLLND